MRSIFLVLLSFLLLNCEDKHSGKKTNNTLKETTQTTKDSIAENEVAVEPETNIEAEDNNRLTDENAMEFFLQYEKENPENKVRITTTFGDIDILLFNETKFHRANFIFLTKQGYFNGTQFYRVIDNFIVQAGNSDDPKVSKKRNEIGRYLLPTDTKRGFKHDRGVISMPSSEIDNPYKLASPFEFFIVQQKGGAHHLDGDYTIFGKVIKGMDVVDTIAKQKTDEGDWPLHNIYIEKVEIIE
ncbi:peptidylprolyl isomerase [Xanthomarina sp.]|jgi:cyclophilin family peptidyl-prolyl cis-trans isomerase|uniref:peptidylprolyl isomerase n=1 Tax=Xanthomarina TaxID=1868329 RepID=UPI00257ACF30|nr:peptidylprolyl isomerase [Xanthomarina sp.]|tara:strand:- start:121 stop:846 length:726 start_codon:yes stop_codon:yes gene_type:complete